MSLNLKQIRFADEYIRNGVNGTQAAIQAGYSPKTTPMIKQNTTAISTTVPSREKVMVWLETTVDTVCKIAQLRKMPSKASKPTPGNSPWGRP